MTLLALLSLILILGNTTLNLEDNTIISVERSGGYDLRAEWGHGKVWILEGRYNVAIRTYDLGGGKIGVILVMTNTSSRLANYLMYETQWGYVTRVDLVVSTPSSCSVGNLTAWRAGYLEEFKPLLRGTIEARGEDSSCRIVLDTGRAAWLLGVRGGGWASMTVSGPEYSVVIAYSVTRSTVAHEGVTSATDSTVATWLPETPIPVEAFEELYGGSRVNYLLIIGLLSILAIVVVLEFARVKRGD